MKISPHVLSFPTEEEATDNFCIGSVTSKERLGQGHWGTGGEERHGKLGYAQANAEEPPCPSLLGSPSLGRPGNGGK